MKIIPQIFKLALKYSSIISTVVESESKKIADRQMEGKIDEFVFSPEDYNKTSLAFNFFIF